MSKFWTFATLLLLTGIILTLQPAADQGINFTDLETECRYDRATEANVDLNHRKLSFSGQYPVANPDADLSYSYLKDSDSVTLNVQSSNVNPLTHFYNTCKAMAVYKAETDSLEPGRYLVTVEHNGKEVNERVIRID